MPRLKLALRWLLGIVMVVAGVAHMRDPEPFVRIVPAWLPSPLMMVYVSGVAEIAGGVGLLIPLCRRAAAWGLIALFVAVFPANVNQAMNHIPLGNVDVPSWVFWLRLPLQAALIALAYWFTRADERPAANQ